MEYEPELFRAYLEKEGFSNNTLLSYLSALTQFYRLFNQMNSETLRSYKSFLLDNHRPSTVNTRICALNHYIDFMARSNPAFSSLCHLTTVRCRPKPFLDSIISQKDYNRLKGELKKEENWYWYFLIRVMACTGVRVSELVQIKAEHLRAGYMDICSKGCKMRRIYFPSGLKQEFLPWLDSRRLDSGLIFTGKTGKALSSRAISQKLKYFARKYHIPPNTVSPHSFRHRFAKNFLSQYNDISLLADLLGHSSLKTTRIYLTKSSNEQRKAVDRIVTW